MTPRLLGFRRPGAVLSCARPALIAVVALLGLAPRASADWLIVPFVGAEFGARTTIVDLDQGVSDKKLTFGGSVLLLSDQVLGVEADLGHTPHFFERDQRTALVLNSTVSTATGNVVLAAPLSVTRESLRPYLVGGIGLMHASSSDLVDLFSFDSNLLALDIGGGAIGMLSRNTGLRFDLRQFRNLTPDRRTTTTAGTTRLSFWRASLGIVIRY